MKVISGGQTGVDRIGLEVARDAGIPTGGTAPKGWRTENGPDPSLKDFGLIESSSSSYTPRTAQNVYDSDGTVLFGNMLSSGSQETLRIIIQEKKPYIINPKSGQVLLDWMIENDVHILNVAGNRGSKFPTHKRDSMKAVLKEAFDTFPNTTET